MLNIHCKLQALVKRWVPGEPLPKDAIWIDLLDADAAEIEVVEASINLRLPSREDLGGIGLASRNRGEAKAVYLHISHYAGSLDESSSATPLGIALNADILVTQRYVQSPAFDDAAHTLHCGDSQDSSSAFMALLEAIATHLAERMQDVADDLAELSEAVFVSKRLQTRTLRNMMLRVGKLETRLTRGRASLLGINRLTGYLCDRQPDWLPDAVAAQLRSVATDLDTLDTFDDHLTGKMQFLFDAILGFIDTDQNEVMRLLTVATVVTIPPVILAGIWGMNFRHMPELKWYYGYPLALAALFVSIVVPLLWFKWKGWLGKD